MSDGNSQHSYDEDANGPDADRSPASEAWSDFAPSFPALISKSRQMVAAVSKLGDCIDDFEILSLLGEGAFGKVFLARQISLDREVALKVTANFGHEGRTMARLEHSHVVQVFSETVDSEQELRLLCMQYVPGATLHQIIQRLRKRDRDQRDGQAILEIVDELSSRPATLDPARLRDREVLGRSRLDEAVCWIGQQLAEALAYAHGRNVLHRDIKPANVMVNQYGQPMLTDFSLSFPVTGIANIGAAVFGGTLGYMAPEHLDALNPEHSSGPDAVGERSDVYSLGAVLLDLMTGVPRVPSDEPSLDGRHLDRIAANQRDVGEVLALLEKAEVAPPLARIICRCLEPDPDNRYQSSRELAEALSGCRELLRVERSLSPGGTLTRWATARPLLFILLLTIVPNIAASTANIAYNLLVVIKDLTPAQQVAFERMLFWYNAVIVVVMALMMDRTLLAAARRWRKLEVDPRRTVSDVKDARHRTLSLPFWTVVLGCVGWLPFALTIPLGMEILAGPIDRGVMLHLSMAFLVTGLIAIVANYYVVAFVVLRAMYTRLWGDVHRLHETAAAELSGVPRRNRLFQVLAGLTPLGAATLLVLVGPEQFTEASFDRFRGAVAVLIGMGIAGFWLATTATAFLNEVVAVLTTASREERTR